MKYKNKFFVQNCEITSPYFISDDCSKLLITSDIHFQPSVNKELFLLLIKYAQEVKPDYILMPGDMIETMSFLDYSSEKDFFENIIRSLAEICPVIMIPGNHEISDFSPSNFKNRLSNDNTNLSALKYFDSLNKIKNVYFLNNESISFGKTTFFGFNPKLNSYQKINDDKVIDDFIEDYIKTGFNMAKDCYNILLTHSPLQIVDGKVLSAIPDFKNVTDLVVSGHLHDGYLPKIMDKKYKNTNVGLFFTPLVFPTPGILCRGIHDFGRGYLFISQGFRKWTADIKLLNAFEKITANDVEELLIKKSDSLNNSELYEYKPFVKK